MAGMTEAPPGTPSGGPEGPPRALGSREAPSRAALASVPLRSVPRPSLLAAPLTALRGAGPRLASLAAGLGIETLGDLLLHVPRDHRDRTAVTPLSELRIGAEGTVEVVVRRVSRRAARRRRMTIVEARVADPTGEVTAVWFNQAWLADRLRPGTRLLVTGRMDRRSLRVSSHAILEGSDPGGERPGLPDAASAGEVPQAVHAAGLVPAHPSTEGLRSRTLREWAWQAMGWARHAPETIPAPLRARRGMPGVRAAIRAAHFPDSPEDLEAARRRLAYEEMLLLQTALAARRRERHERGRGPDLGEPGELVARWLGGLPFAPTGDQGRALAEIDGDLASGRPMQRLLMGEVGSGKTVVALYAMLRAVESGAQAALMAPTETLAEQHFLTVEHLLSAEALPAALITGSTPAARRAEAVGRLASGELRLVVGTHALIEESVAFSRLAVCVVDEQHRFGVRQRAALDAKGPAGLSPHVLHMTATPIPRTLSLTAYGDLDTTVLRELPAGRQPIRTWVVGEGKRDGAYRFIRDRVSEGRQAYVVCPLVEASDRIEAAAAVEEAERLAAGPFRSLRLECLHGKMPSREKQDTMARFAAGDVDVLVATSVIEVGIDVPNASVILIEGADRYGLSQLHQLRGRVGRGAHESHCILFAEGRTELARRRLEAIASESDGFRLAEVDLALRGEGELLGTRQHGMPRFRVARLPEDVELLMEARRDLRELLAGHGGLDVPELEPLTIEAERRFGGPRIEA